MVGVARACARGQQCGCGVRYARAPDDPRRAGQPAGYPATREPQRLLDRGRCLATVQPFAVPDEQPLDAKTPQRPRRPQPQERVHARRLVPRAKERNRPQRVRADEHTSFRPPERDLAPPATAKHGQELERHSGSATGAMCNRTPNRAANAAWSRVCRSRSWITPAGSPSARMRSSTPGASIGSAIHTRPSTASACDVRRGCALGPTKAEVALVDEAGAHASRLTASASTNCPRARSHCPRPHPHPAELTNRAHVLDGGDSSGGDLE